MTDPVDAKLYQRALRLLALREHTALELARKLAAPPRAPKAGRRGGRAAPEADGVDASRAAAGGTACGQAASPVDGSAVEAVLTRLQAQGYLSEQRVLESVLAARAPRMGARRLRQVLQQRGVDDAAAAQALAALAPTEMDRAQAVWARKFGGAAADARAQAAQARFLLGRGFDAGVVRKVLQQAARGAAGGLADALDAD